MEQKLRAHAIKSINEYGPKEKSYELRLDVSVAASFFCSFSASQSQSQSKSRPQSKS